MVRGKRVRPFVALISSIFFLVLLRTHTPSTSLEAIQDLDLNASPGAAQGYIVQGNEYFQGTGRHVLNLQKHFKSIVVGSPNHTNSNAPRRKITRPCENVREHAGFPDTCSYVRANTECHSGTVIEYTIVYYCTFSKAPALAYVLFFLWLLVLFYMLGNTAADYFCCSLEMLSDVLKLPPTVSGVSLLPLGNGAPDVFASIAAFMGTGHSQVGLNSVLGGAVFVASVVAGSVSLAVQPASPEISRPRVDFKCFLRDVGFFLLTLVVLSKIIYNGTISFVGALGYLALYVLYGITVATYELFRKRSRRKRRPTLETVRSNEVLQGVPLNNGVEGSLESSSDCIDDSPSSVVNGHTHWDWQQTYHVAIYSQTSLAALEAALDELDHGEHLHEHLITDPLIGEVPLEAPTFGKKCLDIVEFPLMLPRRLTIPIVEAERWSWQYAVACAILAPSLLAAVWDSNDGEPFGSSPEVYFFGGIVGTTLGLISFYTLEKDRPPTRWLLPWVTGGFVMSVVWFYLIANELVALLVALGVVLEIDSAVLGLTVLAWGNSIGDLISNMALANHGDDGTGVQIAISGCYAEPMFNTLVGLGLSFVLASWKSFPAPLILPEDNTLIYTIGFLFISLLWALIVLPLRKMQPNKLMGVGLLLLYASFMSLRLVDALGIISLDGYNLGSAPGFLGVRLL